MTLKGKILIFTFSLFLIVLFFFSIKTIVESKNRYLLNYNATEMYLNNLPYLPVEMEGKVYNFIFDTGSTYSTINPNLAKKLFIFQKKDSIHTVMISPTYSNIVGYLSKKVDFRIADKTFYQSFIIHEFPGKEFSGIIGMDIISQFYWLFDMEHKTIQFSRRNMKLDIIAPYEKMRICYKKFRETPYLNLLINDTLSVQALFDTGAFSPINAPKIDDPNTMETIAFADLLIHGDIKNDSVLNYLKHKMPSYAFLKNMKNLSINKELKINGYYCSNFIAVHMDNEYKIPKELDVISRKITASFLTRFNKVYIDPFNQEITFIKQTKTSKE